MGPATGIAATAVDVRLAILLIMGPTPDNIGSIMDKDEAKVLGNIEASEAMPSTEERKPLIIGQAVERANCSGVIAALNAVGTIPVAKPTRPEVRPPNTDVSDFAVVATAFVREEIGSVPV